MMFQTLFGWRAPCDFPSKRSEGEHGWKLGSQRPRQVWNIAKLPWRIQRGLEL